MAAIQNHTKLIDRFLQTIAAERAVSKHTLAAYHNDLSVVAVGLAHLSSDTAAGGLQTASADDLRKELHLWHKQGLTARTIARRLSALRHFMSWMLAENHRADNPCQFLDSPKLPQSLPKSLSEDEVITLIEASAHLPETQALQMRAGLELLYAGGLRISELLALRVQDMAGDRKMLVIKGKGGRERLSPLTAVSVEVTRLWLAHRDADGPVTHSDQLLADKKSEALIREEIGKHYPQHGVFGEEEGYTEGNGLTWVLDPIDPIRPVLHCNFYHVILKFNYLDF